MAVAGQFRRPPHCLPPAPSPVPSFRNSPFRRYLSNGPCPVPQFALQPQFRPIFRIFNFGKLRYYYSNNRRYDPPSVFRISVFWGFPGSGTSPGGFFGKIQYRTTRFCGVSCPHVLQTWYGRFFAQSLANSKVQIWGKKGREKIRVLLVLIFWKKRGEKIIKVGGPPTPRPPGLPAVVVVVTVIIFPALPA